ncbi:MAG: hypothetical protein MZV63_27440 [Marinilabiliales bacterium]|nr:hypothetical protein [Marinilabiliales bacterium]
MQERIVNVPGICRQLYSDLGVAGTGEILYIVRPQTSQGASKLHKYSLSKTGRTRR